jgi:nucleotide-binding universal stress UspA family protein
MRMLVPMDLSSATDRVLAATRAVARDSKAEVWLLHVGEPNPDFVGYETGSEAVRGVIAHEYRGEHRKLQEYAEALRAEGIAATALTIRGPTAATILNEARRLGVELIVMATHGRGAVFDLLVGSVSHAVLRDSRVPVLLVPARD